MKRPTNPDRCSWLAAAGLFATLLAQPASAVILWDYSPDTTGAAINQPGPGSTWANEAQGQNFVERILFASGVTVTGMSVYSGSVWGFVGDPVKIRLWSDSAGLPDALLVEIDSVVSLVDTDGTSANPAFADVTRKFAAITGGLSLLAGVNYWIGMSGDGIELGQQGLGGVGAPDDASMYLFRGTAPRSLADTGDMAFRLYDAGTPVPEPSTLLLLGLAGAALASARRRKR